jgi:lipooligosaccharide transport system permease protein
MLPTHRAFRVWHRNLMSWRRYAPAFLVATLGEPLFLLFAVGYGLGRFVPPVDGVPYVAFLLPGLIATNAMYSASFETTFGSFTRMSEQHTYAAILATPCSVADVVAGDILWAATKGALAAFVILLVTTPLGLFTGPLALGLVVVGFLVGLLFGALGLVVTAWSPSYDFFNYYFTLGLGPLIFVFGNVFFPLSSLPPWVAAVAQVLPLSHAVALARAFAGGTLRLAHLGDALWIVVLAMAGFAVAERLIRRRLLV